MNDSMILLRAIGITGMVIVLGRHVQMDWWEGGVLSFGFMLFFGNIGIR